MQDTDGTRMLTSVATEPRTTIATKSARPFRACHRASRERDASARMPKSGTYAKSRSQREEAGCSVDTRGGYRSREECLRTRLRSCHPERSEGSLLSLGVTEKGIPRRSRASG